MEAIAASTEITVLGWSVVLLLVHIVVQASSLHRDAGLGYLVSARDQTKPVSLLTDHLTRGLRNFLETYTAFVALALALAITGRTGGLGATGAVLWLVARVIYVPIFAAGIPVLRTLTWTASIIGLVLMLVKLMS